MVKVDLSIAFYQITWHQCNNITIIDMTSKTTPLTITTKSFILTEQFQLQSRVFIYSAIYIVYKTVVTMVKLANFVTIIKYCYIDVGID